MPTIACSAIISIPGQPTGIANGRANANQFLGQIETGYKFGLGLGANTSISPFARLQIGSINQSAFTEYGGGMFNLAVAAQTTTSVRTTFGIDLAGGFDIGGTLLDLGLRLGWMHEFADTARPMTAAFAAAPVSQFTVLGATPQRDSAVIGFSASTAISDRTSLFASYDGEVGGGTDNHSLRAGLWTLREKCRSIQAARCQRKRARGVERPRVFARSVPSFAAFAVPLLRMRPRLPRLPRTSRRRRDRRPARPS